jgi:hypothetical protein
MIHDFNEFLRDDVKAMVNAHCRKSGDPHSLAWRYLYLRLEKKTGYRVPEGGKSKLKTIEAAGYLEDLHEVAKTLN